MMIMMVIMTTMMMKIIRIVISHILKEPNNNDTCRKYDEESETIQGISAGCQILAPTKYVLRHEQLARLVYQNPATK